LARIAGVDLPKAKRVEIALTYIFGIGRTTSIKILEKAGIDPNLKTDNLSDGEVAEIRKVIDSSYQVEGDLRKDISINIKRLIELGSYRGLRHRKRLPVRGQRTKTNSRTRKGPKQGIGGRKK
jgi:small subunit ribosomal protein S13